MTLNPQPSLDEFQSRLVEALRRRGIEERGDAPLEAIGECVAPRESLAAAEVVFLIEEGGMQESDLSATAVLRASAEVALAQAAAAADAIHGALSTQEVADLMGFTASHVAQRKLYTIARRHGQGHRFPTWQFADNKAVPGLRGVIAALPVDMHPLDVAAFMTAPHEDLRTRP